MKAPAQARSTLHRAAAESTQQRLKLAALQALDDLGLSNFKIAEVIGRAEVARGTYYLYFKDSDEILRAIALDFIAGLEQTLAALPVEHELLPLLNGVMGCYVRYIIQNRTAATLTYQMAGSDAQVMTRFDTMIRQWAGNAATAIARTGSSQESKQELTHLSFAMICMLEGYFRYALRGDNVSARTLQRDANATAASFVKIWSRAVSG